MPKEIDRDFLNKIKDLDDETLRSAVKSIAQAAGVNPKAAERATANINQIKRKLETMSDKELKAAIDSAGPEKAAEIMDLINKSINSKKQ